jgi:hypothetical protein
MASRAGLIWLGLLIVLPGCFPTTETALIPATPFGSTTPNLSRFAPEATPAATTEAATNVARVGLKVVCANPAIGVKPHFITIGGENAPLELFHNGDSDVFITETLARQCKNEGELASLLSTELGRIVSERTVVRASDVNDRGPPPYVPVGNDYGGTFGPADGTRMMELAKYERNRAIARAQTAPPAPDVLARVYMKNAGYNPADVDSVASLLRLADGSSKLEKLVTAPGTK